jgi:hypothetical protein
MTWPNVAGQFGALFSSLLPQQPERVLATSA